MVFSRTCYDFQWNINFRHAIFEILLKLLFLGGPRLGILKHNFITTTKITFLIQLYSYFKDLLRFIISTYY